MAIAQTITELLGAKLPLILPSVAVILAVLLFQNVLGGKPLASIPVVGHELGGDEKRRQAYLLNASGMYLDGYKKVGCAHKSQNSASTAHGRYTDGPEPVQKQHLQHRHIKS